MLHLDHRGFVLGIPIYQNEALAIQSERMIFVAIVKLLNDDPGAPVPGYVFNHMSQGFNPTSTVNVNNPFGQYSLPVKFGTGEPYYGEHIVPSVSPVGPRQVELGTYAGKWALELMYSYEGYVDLGLNYLALITDAYELWTDP